MRHITVIKPSGRRKEDLCERHGPPQPQRGHVQLKYNNGGRYFIGVPNKNPDPHNWWPEILFFLLVLGEILRETVSFPFTLILGNYHIYSKKVTLGKYKNK